MRTLFSDMCNYLGTLGSLISLVRESVGPVNASSALMKKDWPQDKNEIIISKGMLIQDVLPFDRYILNEKQVSMFRNGAFLKPDLLLFSEKSRLSEKFFWMMDESGQLLGLGEKTFPTEIKPKINFHSEEQASLSSDHDHE